MGTRPTHDDPPSEGARRFAFLRLPQVLALVPVSKSSWYSGIKTGRYPPPVKLGPRISVWREEEIIALIERPRWKDENR
jgi:prophage regulatory protein